MEYDVVSNGKTGAKLKLKLNSSGKEGMREFFT
jgi:hypothetical protein